MWHIWARRGIQVYGGETLRNDTIWETWSIGEKAVLIRGHRPDSPGPEYGKMSGL